ncbi:gamma-type small acid-soluble spore protein [Staphylospora marina]|uniref:gamma-type small acid-soluble spore protein n=1 Tax=Staphylospora marina TaxID=2490858 RepID=UPI000F5B898C|nr:gamma-type small acid-soluble spore protein [Staphylospora marina]
MERRNQLPQESQTNAAQVRRQNQASQQGMNNEFASETNAQRVREQNAQSEARKNRQQPQA